MSTQVMDPPARTRPAAQLEAEDRATGPAIQVEGRATRPSQARARASSSRVTRLRYWRRRATVLVALLAVAFLATGLIGRVGAEAELEDKVAGHAVVQPGQTLWDVAEQTAPEGMDTREHLDALRALNGFDGSGVEAWTVVLVPAR